jgi:hypothetical protein
VKGNDTDNCHCEEPPKAATSYPEGKQSPTIAAQAFQFDAPPGTMEEKDCYPLPVMIIGI